MMKLALSGCAVLGLSGQVWAQVTPVETGVGGINWNTIILALISLCGTALTGIMAIYLAKVSSNTGKTVANSETTKVAAVETAKKVEAVRTDLEQARSIADEKLDGLAKVAHDTHVLVNNNMAVQLKLGMELSEFKAATTQRPEDQQAARLARSMYEEHVKKQAIVDRGGA